jgi:RNA polymerase sigma-70 factor (ECF subfamily)
MQGLYAFHSGYVAGLAFKLLGRSHEVDDLVQDVFLAALTGLGALREPRAVRGWLATLTVRLAGRKLRRRKVAAFFSFDDGQGHEVQAPGATAEQRTLLHQVYAQLHRLPVDQRIAWTLHHVEGETLEAVATLCRCSLATAKRRIAAAHQHLEEALSR